MIRILSNGELAQVIHERQLSNGLYEVELVSNSKNQTYRAIMSEIKIPDAALCKYLIEHLSNVSMPEEHESLEMARAIMRKDKAFHINAIIEIIPYLVRIGILEYRKEIAPHNGRVHFIFKRACADDQAASLLSSPPPLSSQEGGGEESSKPKKKKKKKKKCCDNPHPVKSKKTGKRRCKNCGAKLKKKKKKVKE